jgi:6-phosphofructokinase
MTHSLRTTAGSHERILVIEVFGRYAGFTALLPTMAGAATRCVIPEYKFRVERLTELLVRDRAKHPSNYSVALVSEGATFEEGEMVSRKRRRTNTAIRNSAGSRHCFRPHQGTFGKAQRRKVNASTRLGHLRGAN